MFAITNVKNNDNEFFIKPIQAINRHKKDDRDTPKVSIIGNFYVIQARIAF